MTNAIRQDCGRCGLKAELQGDCQHEGCLHREPMTTPERPKAGANQPETNEQAVLRLGRVGSFAPGEYLCVCATCERRFWGDKRALRRLPCAVAQLSPPPAAGVVEAASHMVAEATRAAAWITETNRLARADGTTVDSLAEGSPPSAPSRRGLKEAAALRKCAEALARALTPDSQGGES